MKKILIFLLFATSVIAEPEAVFSIFSRTDWEANKHAILTAQMTLIQKRDWGDSSDTNNVLSQYDFSAVKDGQEHCLFYYAVCKMGEVLPDDWTDYTATIGTHMKTDAGLETVKSVMGFTLDGVKWYDKDTIPYVPDNKQSNIKGKGFEIAYAIAQPYYADKDKSSILVNIKNLPDTAENRAVVDAEFDKDTYVLQSNTNIPVYVWSQAWDKDATVSRKDCKKAQQQGSANASCGILRSTDKAKVMEHYKVKEKDK
jgi:hypothetical protein